MRISKKSKVIIICFLLFGVGFVSLRNKWHSDKINILARCNFMPPIIDRDILDCYGVVGLLSSDVPGAPKYTVKNVKDFERIASVNIFKQFKVVDDTFYVIDQSPGNCFDQVTNKYCLTYLVGQYEKKSDVPAMLAIDINTGRIRAYQFIDQVPTNEKIFFEQLQKVNYVPIFDDIIEFIFY